MTRKQDEWLRLGERVARARKAAHLNQHDLASKVGIDRTALTKVESGVRGLDALELARIAQVVGRTIDWFVLQPSRAVAGRRAKLAQEELGDSPADIALEDLARDVELLQELGLLKAETQFKPRTKIKTVEDAEAAAEALRRHLKLESGPVWELQRVVEGAGLFAFSLDLGADILDGSYLGVGQCGVALVNGRQDPGRRRFTLAHELGHHVFQDPYSSEWVVDHSSRSREKLVNAFAIHFLAPGRAFKGRWRSELAEHGDRDAAIVLAAEFGLSWTAICAHLCNLDLVGQQVQRKLEHDPPRRHDYLELGLSFPEELAPPCVPPQVTRAVLKAFKAYKVSSARAVEMLHETVLEEELPELEPPPLESLRAEVEAGSNR
jgi:Zn-dependent peptidase ImmA (M78 family)/DNA-binding XRE family transcriptional regulator